MMTAKFKAHYKKLLLEITLYLCAPTSNAQNQNAAIEVNIKASTQSEAIVTMVNPDDFPHLVLVKIFNRGAEENLIAETKATVNGKEGLSLEIKSNPGAQFGTSLTWKVVESIGDNRTLNKDNHFQLPFPSNFKVRICQSPDGPLTIHIKDKLNAIDFCAPEKTPIVAAKDGTVFEVIQNYTEGGRDPSLLGRENKIRILHEDGLISEYAHLYPNSANVNIGDKVKRGQQIALLGNVGYSSGVHLHFEVSESDSELNAHNNFLKIVPITFVDPSNKEIKIQYGRTYTINGISNEASTIYRLHRPGLRFN